MRDPKRIERILGLLRSYWLTYPDLRLGQIVSNMSTSGGDVFYMEDDELEAGLRKALKMPPQAVPTPIKDPPSGAENAFAPEDEHYP